ncbi:MAG: PAS domain S-box protein [Bacteroidia bacterium]|nr:PAS domain S-box protein [Bacteroidia bacterium]
MKGKEADPTHNLLFYQLSLEGIADGLFWVNYHAEFIRVNEAACRSLGYTREELLQLKAQDINPNYTNDIWERAWKMLREEKILRFETVHRHKDGHIFPVEITNHYLEFEGMGYSCAIVRDITQRKSTEEAVAKALLESEDRYRMIFESSREAIFIKNRQGAYVDINEAACRLSGYSREEFAETKVTIHHLYPEVTSAAYQNYFDLVMEGQVRVDESYLIRKDGSRILMEFTNQRVKIGNAYFMHTTARDLSEQKKTEARLKAIAEAEKAANQAKSQFMANMSHELRTPCTAF